MDDDIPGRVRWTLMPSIPLKISRSTRRTDAEGDIALASGITMLMMLQSWSRFPEVG